MKLRTGRHAPPGEVEYAAWQADGHLGYTLSLPPQPGKWEKERCLETAMTLVGILQCAPDGLARRDLRFKAYALTPEWPGSQTRTAVVAWLDTTERPASRFLLLRIKRATKCSLLRLFSKIENDPETWLACKVKSPFQLESRDLEPELTVVDSDADFARKAACLDALMQSPRIILHSPAAESVLLRSLAEYHLSHSPSYLFRRMAFAHGLSAWRPLLSPAVCTSAPADGNLARRLAAVKAGPLVELATMLAPALPQVDLDRLLEDLQILYGARGGDRIVLPKLRAMMPSVIYEQLSPAWKWLWFKRRFYSNSAITD